MNLRKYFFGWKDETNMEENEEIRFGKLEYENGDVYKGLALGEIREGFGTYLFSFGDRYEGQYSMDSKNGFGCYYFENGDSYIGEFRDNLKHGLGKFMVCKNGKVLQGRWESDKLVLKMNDYVFSYAKEVELEEYRNVRCSSSGESGDEKEYSDYELEDLEGKR